MADPVVIVGAGISGLLLAQYLQKSSIFFRIFERDIKLTAKAGWGLTLHLPALQCLLPEDLYERLPETFVDRAAVEKGEGSKFPFFDLSTCKLIFSAAGDPQRIRVSRQRLRELLTSGLDIQVKCSRLNGGRLTIIVGQNFHHV
jgi:2-polyprenyl-6-methoxyphenol hydroxylase-like FAD-dependent oxidoreductase